MSTPNADAGFNIDFGALKAQASEMLDKAEATRELTPETPVVETPVVETPAADKVDTPAGDAPVVETTVEEVVTPKVADLTDDAIVKVTVDGEEVEMPWKDARAGISRTSKFTKSMQQLATERKAFEAEKGQLDTLRAERDQVNTFLNNPALVATWLQQVNPNAFATPQQVQEQAAQIDPNAVITMAEAQAISERQSQAAVQQVMHQMQTMQAQQDQKILAAQHTIEHKQQTAKHAAVLNNTLSEIYTANPVLKAIPNSEDVIRFQVAQMITPQTTEAEAVEMFKTVAQGMTESISQHFTATKKVAAVAEAKQKLVTKSIEPKGGSAPQMQPTTYKDANGQVSWKKVADLAKNYMNS